MVSFYTAFTIFCPSTFCWASILFGCCDWGNARGLNSDWSFLIEAWDWIVLCGIARGGTAWLKNGGLSGN